MSSDTRATVESLGKDTYRCVIGYPRASSEELKNRLNELKQLEITALEFSGRVQINGVRVLGKGHVGVVVKAYRKDEQVAIKIRRTDANRLSMQHEAEMLRLANTVSVGPRLLGTTKNILLMEYVEGVLFPEWIGRRGGVDTRRRVRDALRIVLEQAWNLDQVGLDHGELSNASRHVVVRANGEPCLLDFETSSTVRRAANVTSLCQYLFLRSLTREAITEKLGDIDKDCLVSAIRNYKLRRNKESFLGILTASNIS